MSPSIVISAQAGGTVGKAGLGGGMRAFLSGENFFTAIFTAKHDGDELTLAPAHLGEIVALEISEEKSYSLTSGAFMACEAGVAIDIQYGGMKGWLAQKGIFLMVAKGKGTLFASTFGAIQRKELKKDERFILDNRYVVAFTAGMHYELVRATESLKASVLSGEGFVNRYTGPGEVIFQTRSKQRSSGLITGLLQAMF